MNALNANYSKSLNLKLNNERDKLILNALNANYSKSLKLKLNNERDKQIFSSYSPFKNSIEIIKNPSNASNDAIQKVISAELNNIKLMRAKADLKPDQLQNGLSRSQNQLPIEKTKKFNENHMENKFFAEKRLQGQPRCENKIEKPNSERDTSFKIEEDEWNQYNIYKGESNIRRKISIKTPFKLFIENSKQKIERSNEKVLNNNFGNGSLSFKEREINKSSENIRNRNNDEPKQTVKLSIIDPYNIPEKLESIINNVKATISLQRANSKQIIENNNKKFNDNVKITSPISRQAKDTTEHRKTGRKENTKKNSEKDLIEIENKKQHQTNEIEKTELEKKEKEKIELISKRMKLDIEKKRIKECVKSNQQSEKNLSSSNIKLENETKLVNSIDKENDKEKNENVKALSYRERKIKNELVKESKEIIEGKDSGGKSIKESRTGKEKISAQKIVKKQGMNYESRSKEKYKEHSPKKEKEKNKDLDGINQSPTIEDKKDKYYLKSMNQSSVMSSTNEAQIDQCRNDPCKIIIFNI